MHYATQDMLAYVEPINQYSYCSLYLQAYTDPRPLIKYIASLV